MGSKCIIIFLILFGVLCSTSCRKDFEYEPSAGNLSFSRDTVYLDTVFSNIGSSTYSLKVYNTSAADIRIPSISLRNGTESLYRLNVDGVAGNQFSNTPILGKDSLFIFIETTIDISDDSITELLYTDAILFDTETNQQEVELVTLAKKAVFLFPEMDSGNATETIELYTDENGNPVVVTGFELDAAHLNFTNEKPYVIYGYAIVPNGKELVVDAGARIHFHENSGLLVQNGATLTVNGALSTDLQLLEQEVIFEGDRLEPSFSERTAQWGAVWLERGSMNNRLNHMTIKNAQIGLFVEADSDLPSTTLTITNSQIYNNSLYNLWAKNASIIAENVVLGGAGIASLQCENGGNYTFTHCSISNYWNKGFRTTTALTLKNIDGFGNDNAEDLVRADFANCIIDGNTQNEITLQPSANSIFNFNFKNCFIKLVPPQSPTVENLYDVSNPDFYEAILTKGHLDYFAATKNDFRIGLETEVKNRGALEIANTVPIDLVGTPRTMMPDLGAYQSKEKQE